MPGLQSKTMLPTAAKAQLTTGLANAGRAAAEVLVPPALAAASEIRAERLASEDSKAGSAMR